MKYLLSATLLLLTLPLAARELYKTPQPPTIDGVAEELWQAASEFPLVNIKSDKPLVMGTVARLMYDDQNLYAFVTCREANLIEARSQERFERHDAPVWGNCCVEFFIDARNDGRAYYQFIVDIHGSVADLLHYDPAGPTQAIDWNGFWRHAIGDTSDGWSVEVAIPWRTLDLAPGTLPRLGLNISRVRRIAPFERGTLAVGSSSISDLAAFLQFENLQLNLPELSAIIQPGVVFLGQNQLNLLLQNHTDKPLAGALELVGTDAAAQTLLQKRVPLELAAGERRDMTLEYQIDQPGRVQLTLNLIRDDGTTFLDLADYLFRQPIELHERHPLAFVGEEHPIYAKIFTDSPTWQLDVAVRDTTGTIAAEADDLLKDAAGFLLLPTGKLGPGDYTLNFTLQQTGALYEQSVPLTIIRRP